MIRTPTQRELEALAMLEHDADFKDVMGLLRDSLRATEDRCLSERDEIELRRAQGAATDLKEFLEMVGTARATAEKLRARTP